MILQSEIDALRAKMLDGEAEYNFKVGDVLRLKRSFNPTDGTIFIVSELCENPPSLKVGFLDNNILKIKKMSKSQFQVVDETMIDNEK